MQDNKLTIQINRPIHEVFNFTITPPNSTLWIPNVVEEKTNNWPIHNGTIFFLKDHNGDISEVCIKNIIINKMVEWISKDKNYHCRYKFKSIDKNSTELEYYEWVDNGILKEPFIKEILQKLKLVLES
jgi:hypothetical protein